MLLHVSVVYSLLLLSCSSSCGCNGDVLYTLFCIFLFHRVIILEIFPCQYLENIFVLFFIFIVLSFFTCSSHTIKLIHLKCTVWYFQCIHRAVQPSPLPSSRTFSSTKKKLCAHKQLLQSPPSPQSLATSNLLSVSPEFICSRPSYKQNHTLYGLLCLASSTQHDVFRVRLWGGRVRLYFLFMAG